jgi:hypothetical protein
LEGTEGEERVHDQVELSLEPTLFGDGVVVAFTGDNDGDIWLGVKRSESGSSRRKLYDIEWFDKVGENSYELWDDGIDCWGLSRLLVEGVEVALEVTTGRFSLPDSSIDQVRAALANWAPPNQATDDEDSP